MQGKQCCELKLFSVVDVEKLVPKNHLLRKIDKILDLSFVREATKDLYCADNGRPSVDPELFFRMQIIKYLYYIDSDRHLCDEVQCHLAYRWYCKLNLEDDVPDHSALTKIRDRLGEKLFEKIFMAILQICKDKGLVDGKIIMIDGSFIRANAANKSMTPKDENDDTDYDSPDSPKINNKTHYCKTDPDATLAGNEKEIKQVRYKTHTIIDAKSRVIIEPKVTTGSVHEGGMFQDNVKNLKNKHGITPEEIIADRAYGLGENYVYLEKEGIGHNIPLYHRNVGDQLEGFEYDETNDRFKCPNGKYMYPRAINNSKDISKRYRTKFSDCKDCELKEKCIAKSSRLERQRWLNVSIYHKTQMKVKEREKTEIFKAKMWERMHKLEGIFAEAKNFHGLRRAYYRGKEKVQMQVFMIAAVQNLKRLVNLFISILKRLFANIVVLTENKLRTHIFKFSH